MNFRVVKVEIILKGREKFSFVLISFSLIYPVFLLTLIFFLGAAGACLTVCTAG